jgi:hypothetical protein
VLADSQARLAGVKTAYWQGSGRANSQLRHGTPIRIVPRMAGAQFNPAYLDLTWLEDYHAAEFRVALTSDMKVSNAQQRLDGTIEFRVGPLLIGEVDLWAVVVSSDDRGLLSASPLPSESSGIMYSAIFPSYAHEDAQFIEKLENAYSLLNLRYLRDVKELRAGDCWEPRLRKLIELADVFQLCWSAAAKTSVHVESEWRHALGLARQGFIKPIYWETPMPGTPKELEHLHFRYWHPA